MKRRLCSLALALALAASLLSPAAVQAASGDFVIENGVLTAYKGGDYDVTIPAGVKEIGAKAFQNTTDNIIYTVSFPAGLTKIGYGAFQMQLLRELELPEGLLEIGDAAFFGCGALEEVTIPASVQSVGSKAFSGTRIAKVTLLNPDTVVAEDAFEDTIWEKGAPEEKTYAEFNAELNAAGGKAVVTAQTSSVSLDTGDHLAYIDSKGTLWTWGLPDSNGELGSGSISGSEYNYKDWPAPVAILENVVSVDFGAYHGAAIKADGTLWMWGASSFGALGQEYERDLYTPTYITDQVVKVSCGRNSTAVLKADGSLWMAGGAYGQQGNGDIHKRSPGFYRVMDNVKDVSCGLNMVAAVQSDGSLWTWGLSSPGNLGNGDQWNQEDYTGKKYQSTPLKIMEGVQAVSCGMVSLALKEDGSVWGWGGETTFLGDRSGPVELVSGGVTKVESGYGKSGVNGLGGNAAILKSDGSLWAWGGNGDYNLGLGDSQARTEPAKVMDGVADVALGSHFTLAVRKDGTLMGWGVRRQAILDNGLWRGVHDLWGNYEEEVPSSDQDALTGRQDLGKTARLPGTLALKERAGGTGGKPETEQPGKPDLPTVNTTPRYPRYTVEEAAQAARRLSVGYGSMGYVDEGGTLWTWGFNQGGGLGDGTYENRNTPVKAMDGVQAVAMGGGPHNLALKTDGSVWELHANGPEHMLDGVKAVSSGMSHALALKTDGTLWAWGDNTYGQVGNGSAKNAGEPVKVMDNVAAISAGEHHSAAVKTDGSLWTWGNNLWGQLGDGTEENRLSPVKVLDGVRSVSCGGKVTAILRTDGSVWATGYIMAGYAMGYHPENTQVQSPVQVAEGEDMAVFDTDYSLGVPVAVSSGGTHSAILLSSGHAQTWGKNDQGQLAEEFAGTQQYAPNLITNPKGHEGVSPGPDGDVVAICAGDDNTLILKRDGTVWTAGSNDYGQLGAASHMPFWYIPLQVTFPASAAPKAKASPCPVLVDGKQVAFDAYLLTDASGGGTNYFKLRDVAHVLNGTAAQFNVGWDGTIAVTTKSAYTSPNGSEMSTPFTGDQPYAKNASAVKVDGQTAALDAIVLTDASGSGYTYFKLRDLGKALGFYVGYDAAAGAVLIDTTKPYSE